jgi:glycosyltransferase involved in cell wall biosynthesis/peptidoglycan/xylan/chitin deacetylase (PgdA/CDA1 family)
MQKEINLNPLVSVIIPCYNAEKFVGQAIESALNQTHPDFEIIIINDGSTDKSEEVIKKYCGLDNRIKYFHQQNQGVSLTRNAGIEKSKGDFIAFLDADDAWEPENIEAKINPLLNDSSVDWVFSDMYLADELLNKTEIIEGGNDDDLLNSLLSRKGEAIHAPSNIVVRSNRLKEHNIRFDSKLSTSADWDFCIQLASKKLKGKRIPVPLWSYRVLENSMSRNLKVIENDNLYVHRKAREQKLFKSFLFKQLCFSNNYLILAGIWWVNGNNKLRAIYYIIKSLLYYPPNILKLLIKLKKFNLYQAKRIPISEKENFLKRNISFKTSKPPVKKNITTFLFHRINTIYDPLWNPIRPEHFEQIIIYLKKHFEFVVLTEYLLGNVIPETSKPLCAIGFDDGYRDYLEFALPILKKHNCPSSMYVVTDCIDKDLPPWTYMLNHYFINTNKLGIDIDTKDFPGHLKITSWRNKSERLLFAKQLNPYMKSLSNNLREKIYKDIIQELNDVDPPRGLMLTWDEVKSLHEYNCEVGSHTMNHPVLSKKLSHQELIKELRESALVIEKHTGRFPETISYPFGAYNEDVKKASQEAGYKIGVTVNPGTYDSLRQDLFEVPRIELFDEPFLKTRLRINEIVPKIRKILTLKG